MQSQAFAVLAALVFSSGPATVQAQTTPSRIHGEIVAIDHGVLRIRSASGEETPITLARSARVTQRVPLTLEALQPGVFLGTTAIAQPDGTLLASEVHIFPEERRGTGEGHRPSSDGASTMTNATVKQSQPVSTMTNATVAGVSATPGSRVLHLTYHGGEKTVIVPANTPVVLSKESDRSALKRGEHVIATVARGADGSYVADRVSVGANGSIPPL